jgi:GNAT superfamily N-acetyltransferase
MTEAAAKLPAVGDLVIRPIAPDDKQALKEGFARLSGASRYRRFLSPHTRLSPAELRYFTEVDHHDHEALVALDPGTGAGVGVARYVRSAEDPETAEIAVAVVDDWQRRGVGTRLASALAERAREEGIRSFTGVLLADNELMLNLARELGEVRVLHSEHGTIEIAVELSDEAPSLLKRLLQAVAVGDLRAVPARMRERATRQRP